MKAMLGVLVALVLAGCASEEKFQSNLKSFMGQPESALINALGPPQNVYETGGLKYLSWSSGRNVSMPGVAPTYNTSCIGTNCTTYAVGGSPGYNVNLSCQIVMTIQDGIVRGWRYKGNDCRA